MAMVAYEFRNNAKTLRIAHHLTQEQLAEKLCVSPQAVSRWENNSAMPDITLLIPLANFFEVTTDHLLGVDLSRNEQRINAILCRANAITANLPPPDWSRAIAMLRGGLCLYPGSWALKCRLAQYLLWSDGDLEEMNTLCESIIAECPDPKHRFCAIELIAGGAVRQCNIPRALALAERHRAFIAAKQT